MGALFERLAEKFPSLRNPNLDRTSYDDRQQASSAGIVRFLASSLLKQLLLLPPYLLIVLPLLAYGAGVWFFRLSGEERTWVRRYCREFWFFPTLCFHKLIEGREFAEAEVVPLSIDVGCESGEMTRMHYPGARFDVGMEYVFDLAPRDGPFDHVVCGSLLTPPFAPGAGFRTVSSVHVLDHIEDLEGALRGFREMLAPDGTLYISAFADGYLSAARRFGLGRIDEAWLAERKGFYHFHSIETWRHILEANGFRIRELRGFLGGFCGRVYTLLHLFFETNGSNLGWYVIHRSGVLPRWLISVLFVTPACWLSAPCIRAGAEAPVCMYAVLERDSRDETEDGKGSPR